MYVVWLVIILMNVWTIYDYIIRKKIFSPMTLQKWKIIFYSIILGSIFFEFVNLCGWHQPWLYQEKLYNLKKEEGILRLTHYTKGNYYYLEMENGNQPHLKFISVHKEFAVYEDKEVIIWRNGRYVYQMSFPNSVIYFSINEANSEIFLYNLNGIFIDLFILWSILSTMFLYIYHTC